MIDKRRYVIFDLKTTPMSFTLSKNQSTQINKHNSNINERVFDIFSLHWNRLQGMYHGCAHSWRWSNLHNYANLLVRHNSHAKNGPGKRTFLLHLPVIVQL